MFCAGSSGEERKGFAQQPHHHSTEYVSCLVWPLDLTAFYIRSSYSASRLAVLRLWSNRWVLGRIFVGERQQSEHTAVCGVCLVVPPVAVVAPSF